MPWSLNGKMPDATKNMSRKQKEIFVEVANEVLEETNDESQAIMAGIAQAKEQVDKSLADKLVGVIEKHFSGSQKEDTSKEVTKSVDKEQRMAMFVVLEPDVTDAHNDTYSADEVEKACNNFNTHSMRANLFHKIETEKAKIVQSFITPSSFTTEDGREISKGSWLQWWHFPEGDSESEAIWKMVKEGSINGVSIGARAKTENLE